MIFDGTIKPVPLQRVIDTMAGLGYPVETARTLVLRSHSRPASLAVAE